MKQIVNPRIIYADIINLPHHQEEDRKHMSLYDRAAQFAPFAALVGYDAMVAEEARLTDAELVLSEEERDILNRKIAFINEQTGRKEYPRITVRYFVPDLYKEGGSYEASTGTVKKLDFTEGSLIFFDDNGLSSGKTIPFDRIMEIHGDSVDQADLIDDEWI